MGGPGSGGGTPRRVVLGGMGRRTADRWVMVVTALAAVGILLWFVATRPESRWWAVAWLVAAALFGLGVYSRTWLEVGDGDRPGVLVQRSLWRPARRVVLTAGSGVVIAGRGPVVALEARGGDGAAVHAGLAVGGDRPRSRPPEVLRELADAVAARGVDGGAKAARVLRAQADHVERGRPLAGSPVFRAARAVRAPGAPARRRDRRGRA